jgi:hypothetical protein
MGMSVLGATDNVSSVKLLRKIAGFLAVASRSLKGGEPEI